jgi:hypothetical protein
MRRRVFPLVVVLCLFSSSAVAQQAMNLRDQIWGHLVVTIVDQSTGREIDARCYLTDAAGHHWTPSGAITYVKPPEQDFIALGHFAVELPPGKYTLRVARGTEYRPAERQIEFKGGEILRDKVELSRWINMIARGWYSGDLHNHRDWREMPQILLSEDLNLAPPTTNWVWMSRTISLQPPPGEQPIRRVDATHAYSIYGTEIERNFPGPGAIDLLALKNAIESHGYELAPPNTTYTEEAHAQGGYVDAEKITWRDGAALVALGQVDSGGLVYNSFSPYGVELGAGTIPQDKPEYKTPGGLMYWAMDVYYRLLNCGFKLPVSAGTASGVKPTPLGYDRVYVHLPGAFSYREWFRELKAGHSFATNGPMLFLTVDGHQPGDTVQFASEAPETARQVKAHAEVDSLGNLDRLEILWKGKVVKQVTAPPGAHKLSADITIPVTQTGWVVARAFEKPTETVRFAHTSPVYVRMGSDPGIVPEDAEYFVRLMDLEIKFYQKLSGFRTAADRQAMVNMFQKARAVYERLTRPTTE